MANKIQAREDMLFFASLTKHAENQISPRLQASRSESKTPLINYPKLIVFSITTVPTVRTYGLRCFS